MSSPPKETKQEEDIEEQTPEKNSPEDKNENNEFCSNKWRVKLYKLNQTGDWDDLFTGYVSVSGKKTSIDAKEEATLKLVYEDDESKEILFQINKDTVFHFQRGTILTWKSEECQLEDDLAISFQEKEGILEISNCIPNVEGKICEFMDNDDEEITTLDIKEDQLDDVYRYILMVSFKFILLFYIGN